jgi:serine/threonine-protein kinase
MSEDDRILAGRYRLIEPLGEGGMGTVWKAEHIELGSHLAIKLIDEDLVGSASALARFRQEAKAAAALSSKHVVRTFDYGVEDNVPFIAMELLVGEGLDERIARDGRLSAVDTAHIMSQVARALDRAHAMGIIHRDMKPGNIFLTKDEDGSDRVKVLDFGIAKSLVPEAVSQRQTRTGTLVGSPIYMSPEQMRGKKDLTHSTDLWSLGVVAYECVLGERPFVAESLPELTVAVCIDPIPVPSSVGDVPPGFDEWFAKACNRDPAARFQSAKQLAGWLTAVAEGREFDREAAGLADTEQSVPPPARTSNRPSADGAVLSRSTEALVSSRGRFADSRAEAAGAGRRKVLGLAAAAVVVAVTAGAWMLGQSTSTPEAAPAAGEASAAPAPRPATSAPEVTPAVNAAAPAVVPASAEPSASAVNSATATPKPKPVAPIRRAPPTQPTPPKARDYGF